MTASLTHGSHSSPPRRRAGNAITSPPFSVMSRPRTHHSAPVFDQASGLELLQWLCNSASALRGRHAGHDPSRQDKVNRPCAYYQSGQRVPWMHPRGATRPRPHGSRRATRPGHSQTRSATRATPPAAHREEPQRPLRVARGAQLLKNAQLTAISGNQLDRDAGRLRQYSLACVARMQPAARSFCRGDDQQLGRLGRAPS